MYRAQIIFWLIKLYKTELGRLMIPARLNSVQKPTSYKHQKIGRATKSTPMFIGNPTVANCCLPSTCPTSAVNKSDVCRQRARRLPSTCQTDKITKSSPTSAVDRPDICRQRARQTKFSKVARCLPSTGPTSAINGPDVYRQQARQTKFPKIA